LNTNLEVRTEKTEREASTLLESYAVYVGTLWDCCEMSATNTNICCIISKKSRGLEYAVAKSLNLARHDNGNQEGAEEE
jgi:hypothetical protein